MKTKTRQQIRLGRSRVRTLVQVGMALFVLSMVAARYAEQAGIAVVAWWPNLQGICPIAMVETMTGLFQGQAPADPARANVWILFGSLGLAVVFGALFCGWICPLGAVQDWVGSLGRRIFGKRFNRFVPERVDRALSWLRYVVLALVVVQSVRFIGITASSLNPSRALFHVWFGGAFPAGLVVLGLTLVGSLFVARPWCRWLCPFGAVQGTVSLVSPWTIRRSTTACPSCARCTKACPMGIELHRVTTVRDTRCTRCTECLSTCAVDGALVYSGPAIARRWTLRSATAIAAVALGLFFLPVTIARASAPHAPAGTEQTLAPAEIVPTMTLEEVAAGFGMSPLELLTLLEMDGEFDPRTRIFDIEEDERYEHITVADVRAVLAEADQ